MKRVYRYEENTAYWDRRWTEAGEDKDRFERLDIYPIRYAEMVMTDRSARALEIGCGLGRVLKHYRRSGFEIAGIERSAPAVERMRAADPTLDVRTGDVLGLPYESGRFDVVMAFGVFHNLEEGVERALAETARCLKPGGRFCISMRPNNVEMRLNELYWAWRNRHRRSAARHFHKLLVGESEFIRLLQQVGLRTEQVHHARNVSLLYRLPFLRDRDVAAGSESARRAQGYRLNRIGRAIDGAMTRLFPFQTANVLVFIGRKD